LRVRSLNCRLLSDRSLERGDGVGETLAARCLCSEHDVSIVTDGLDSARLMPIELINALASERLLKTIVGRNVGERSRPGGDPLAVLNPPGVAVSIQQPSDRFVHVYYSIGPGRSKTLVSGRSKPVRPPHRLEAS